MAAVGENGGSFGDGPRNGASPKGSTPAVAATSQITGALLVFALLVAPPAAAQALTPRPWLSLALSVAFALLVTWLGLGVSYFSIYPPGFFVTTFAFGLYVLAQLARHAGALRARHARRREPIVSPAG